MKKIFTIIFILVIAIIKSQSKIIIEYDYSFANMDNLNAFIIGSQDNSFFFFSNDANATYKSLKDSNFSSVNQFYIFNYNLNEENFFQRIYLLPKTNNVTSKLAVEKIKDLDWKITSETKQILGYKVFAATTQFRGRDYKVWFSKDLPIRVFPWKLKGLPGAILEFVDSENFIRGYAKKIILNSEEEFPNKVLKFFSKDDLNLAIPFKKMVELENEVLQEHMNESIAALPKGVKYAVPNIREMMLEKSFEWKQPKP
ncbi:GLPGLI family protein [Chryseobacterium oryzae]|uniref:GLPGLI family protein n=1 Tax=Chryseobacterium oryzae TaxID=2929799 RepID=A0ABY4BJN3_9FLAO|nr:GLPGLI family protein [Chryseobacterium oryzae]UOE39382.1 GLPGLI family protein [Chryseobacterium oryzae]